jgi:endonuclease/exonuclease/phosphatase family metal-dependent hydrolase
VTSPPEADVADEVTLAIATGGTVIERHRAYTNMRTVQSRTFDRGHGTLHVDVSVGTTPTDRVGTSLRVMTFNLFGGGRLLHGSAGEDLGAENLEQSIEFVKEADPDVLFTTETDGAGAEILAGLNAGVPTDEQFQAAKITEAPDDGLWLFTRLNIDEIYPPASYPDADSRRFGGAQLSLPDGTHVHAFPVHLHHLENARVFANRAVIEEALGRCRTDTDTDVAGTDDLLRTSMATRLLDDYIATYADDGAPVLIGGDFNTMSHLDWTAQFSDAPGHEGLTLDWPVTRLFEQAGFTDTYRWANPDVHHYPGRTYDALRGLIYSPDRIDYIFARGDGVRVLESHTVDRRLPQHQSGQLGEVFPFYSDHAAVVTDVVIGGAGAGGSNVLPADEPVNEPPWPTAPDGYPVPATQLTATASTERAGNGAQYAVDGDIVTYWHSDDDPEPTPMPYDLTIDMQKTRTLTAVRFQPPIHTTYGIVLEAVVQASTDGSTFYDVADVTWDRHLRPKDIDLDHVSARYLRFHIEKTTGGPPAALGQLAAAAEVIPYETSPSIGSVERVVDPATRHADCAAAYEESGTWAQSNLTGYRGLPSRYSKTPGSTATWTPELPEEGEYDVAIWWPEHDTTTTSATYTITTSSGTHDITINPQDHMGSWHTLGTWHFTAGTNHNIQLNVDTNTYHRADAVHFRTRQ